jgi:DNA-binding transcriptional LysR family regulator
LSDAVVDLIDDGFDAALRIAVLPDSSLVARKLCPVAPFIVASPTYLAEHGRPIHPSELDGHHCLGYAYRPRQDIWRFSNAAGEEETVTPTGPLRVTNVDALIPTVLDGIGIAELPEFIVAEYLADGRMEAILTDWTLPRGALYFVTPSARARPAKVEALADFLAERLSEPVLAVQRRTEATQRTDEAQVRNCTAATRTSSTRLKRLLRRRCPSSHGPCIG